MVIGGTRRVKISTSQNHLHSLEPVPGECIGGRHADQQGKDRRSDRDDDGIHQVAREIGILTPVDSSAVPSFPARSKP